MIADDFTGATDIAMAYARQGHQVVVVIGSGGATVPAADVVVVALKTRTAPVADAVRQSLDALDRLRAAGCEQFVFKYCSTFDSTDRGNIGPVLDALRAVLGVRAVVVAPAFPENGRTVRDGLLRIGDVLLEDSSMRHHPLTPMTRSRVADLLRPQTAHDVAEVHLDTVRNGVDALRRAIDGAPSGSVVIDTVTDDDLTTLAAATADDVLVTGSAGVALGVARGTADATALTVPDGRRLVLAGSASARTREQLRAARDAGLPVAVVDADVEPDGEVARLTSWVLAQDPQATPVVTSLPDPDHVPTGSPLVATRIEQVLAGVAEQVVRHGVVRLLVAGGETSGAVVERLGLDVLEIGPRIAAGVCWAAATVPDGGLRIGIALKSGNFGEPDMFRTAWEALA